MGIEIVGWRGLMFLFYLDALRGRFFRIIESWVFFMEDELLASLALALGRFPAGVQGGPRPW